MTKSRSRSRSKSRDRVRRSKHKRRSRSRSRSRKADKHRMPSGRKESTDTRYRLVSPFHCDTFFFKFRLNLERDQDRRRHLTVILTLVPGE